MYKPAQFEGGHQTRILVDRRAALGDLVMITPVIRELRRRHPGAWLQVVTEEPGILKNNPNVDLVVEPKDMKAADPWDLYINLNDAYETQVTSHYVDSYLERAFGQDYQNIDHSVEMFPTDEEKSAVDEAVAEFGNDYIVVHMRRWAWENKNIDLETWSMFFTRFHDEHPNTKIVVVGAKHDYTLPPDPEKYINLVGQLSVGEIQYLISRSRAFVGVDSGPFHIASTTDTPIVALISHLLPEQILPWRKGVFGDKITVVTSKVECLGCYARQKPPVNNLICENSIAWACAKSFDNLEMFNAVDNILKGN